MIGGRAIRTIKRFTKYYKKCLNTLCRRNGVFYSLFYSLVLKIHEKKRASIVSNGLVVAAEILDEVLCRDTDTIIVQKTYRNCMKRENKNSSDHNDKTDDFNDCNDAFIYVLV